MFQGGFKMIHRHLSGKLADAATRYPVVTLTGPRQSGKTTLVKHVFPEAEYLSLENPETRTFAINDPKDFLAQFDGPVILDEVQRVPDLLSYIQGIVDDNPEPGRFILTGSQNLLLLESVSQTLAGRTLFLTLLPFSNAELCGNKIQLPGSGGFKLREKPPLRDDLFDVMWTGFYPRIHKEELPPQEWLTSYIEAYIERDVRQMINIGDLEAFQLFLKICAGRCGQLLNLTSIGNDCGLSQPTVRRWLSVLETSFIVKRIEPYHNNFKKTLVKSPKLMFYDTGLLCNLLNIGSKDDLRIHSSRGAIFENFIVMEVFKNMVHSMVRPRIYHWRDRNHHEIDMIIEIDNKMIPVEIKSGKTINQDFFKELLYWRQNIDSECDPILAYGGDSVQQRSGVQVAPWWQF